MTSTEADQVYHISSSIMAPIRYTTFALHMSIFIVTIFARPKHRFPEEREEDPSFGETQKIDIEHSLNISPKLLEDEKLIHALTEKPGSKPLDDDDSVDSEFVERPPSP